MKPFWTYFGGKYRLAPRYPAPLYGTIIEPFAGAAGYALRYPERRIILVEKSPTVAGIWRWLIAATPEQVRGLPRLPASGRLEDAEWPCQAAQDLAGFWITRGAAHPNRSASAWMRDPRYSRWSWGEHAIARIAEQVEGIKHWTLLEGDYTAAPDLPATWFIDPPYHRGGVRYPQSAKALDFPVLGRWCQSRRGQAIVCEQAGATWLPFRHFHLAKGNESVSGCKVSAELVWTSPPEPLPDPTL